MALDLDDPRSAAGNPTPPPPPPPRAMPFVGSPRRPGIPSGPPLRAPGGPPPNQRWPVGTRHPATPAVAPDPPLRNRRSTVLIGAAVAVVVTLGTVSLYVASRGDHGRAAAPVPTTTAAPATFAVDLSTGAAASPSPAVSPSAAVTVAVPTLPLPVISLPMPGAAVPAPTTVVSVLPSVVGLPAGQPPENLGDDVQLEALADRCYAGDMAACDDLYLVAGLATAYSAYGDTCAGRQAELTGELCVTTFGQIAPTTTS